MGEVEAIATMHLIPQHIVLFGASRLVALSKFEGALTLPHVLRISDSSEVECIAVG